MGTVWEAHDEVLGRDVALKEVLPPPDLTESEREIFKIRTFREARAAGRVAHPCVATVYDVLEENGHPWIVMQLVRSRTLGEVVREQGPMPQSQVARIGLQLLEALRAAHAAGVLHRDVKPDNVLLTEDGRAVLTDFGIATTQDEAPVTRTGMLVGTPAFMAPERAAGGPAQPASDLWAVGVTLYQAIEGHSPFHRSNALATLGAVMHAEPTPLARAGALGPVLLGLLRKNPAERMALEEAEQRLTAIISGVSPEVTGPVPAVPPMSSMPPVTPAVPSLPRVPAQRRMPPLLALGAGTVVVALVTGGAAWWSQQPAGTGSTPTVPAVVKTSGPARTKSPSPVKPTPTTSAQVPQDATPRTSKPSSRHRPDDSTRPTEQPKTQRPQPTKPTTSKPPKDDDPPSEGPGEVEPSDGGGRPAHAVHENRGKAEEDVRTDKVKDDV